MTCLKANGVSRIIVNAWDLAKSTAMVREARAIGIAAEDVYCFLYYGLPHERVEVNNALALMKTDGMTAAWLDCESHWRPDTPTEAQGTTLGYRIATTATFRTELLNGGYRPGIYTGKDWWLSNMGNFSGFADAGDSLWLANYGTNDPANPRSPITVTDFGGWTRPWAHQYSSTIEVCGRTEDHNYWALTEDAMTPEEKKAFSDLQGQVARLNAIVAGNGSFPVVCGQNNIAALQYALDAGSLKPGSLYTLTGEQTLRFLWKQGNSAYLGILNLQSDMAKLATELQAAQDSLGETIETSLRLNILIAKYDALAAGISALDDALESLSGSADSDPKVKP